VSNRKTSKQTTWFFLTLSESRISNEFKLPFVEIRGMFFLQKWANITNLTLTFAYRSEGLKVNFQLFAPS